MAVMSALCQSGHSLILSTGTKLIRQCRDRSYFNCEAGMRERSNPD